MGLRAVVLSISFLLPGAVLACPDTDGGQKQYDLSASELWSPLSIELRAGGDIDLSACDELGPSLNAYGYVVRNPDVEFDYTTDQPYDLVVRVAGECDTVLLVNTPSGSYVFNDDNAGRSDPLIRFQRPLPGVYDLWAGTFGDHDCDALVIIETFEPADSHKTS